MVVQGCANPPAIPTYRSKGLPSTWSPPKVPYNPYEAVCTLKVKGFANPQAMLIYRQRLHMIPVHVEEA